MYYYLLRSILDVTSSLTSSRQLQNEESVMNNPKNHRDLVSQSIQENMNQRQTPLTEAYKTDPERARVTDYAKTSSESVPAASPLYGEVSFTEHLPLTIPIGVHTAVGGESDFPTPGDILCGSLAACIDSTIRIIANKVGMPLRFLSVEVSASVDVRGTLRLKKEVPVGFQSMDAHIDIEADDGVTEKMIQQLIKAVEYSCIILQTLRTPPEITLTTKIHQHQH